MSEVSAPSEFSTGSVSINANPLVSVIICTFNRSHYLKEAVASVLDQTYTNIECLLVDDGSTDDTRQVCEDLMSQDTRVKYLYKQNGGVASARNFGVDQARGEWVQFLDSDDWLLPEKLAFQLSYLNNIKEDDIVFYCDYQLVYEETKRYVPIIHGIPREQLIKRLLPFYGMQPGCVLLKKTLLRKTKFNEHILAWEYEKLLLYLLNEGATFIYTPIIGFCYRKHESNLTGSAGVWSSVLKEGTIRYLESVQEDHNNLQDLCQ